MDEMIQLDMPVRARELPGPGVVECWLMNLGELQLPGSDSTDRGRRQALKLRRQFLLRLILGAYLQRPGKDIELVRGPSGKPGLGPSLADSGVHFNLSHSGDWLALALARKVAVGVDIEQHRRLDRSIDLARRYFSASEAEYLDGLTEPQRSETFFRLWTVREACIKAMGTSLARSLGALELAPEIARPLAVPAEWPEPDRWSLLRPALPIPLEICVAVPRPGVSARLIRLNCRTA